VEVSAIVEMNSGVKGIRIVSLNPGLRLNLFDSAAHAVALMSKVERIVSVEMNSGVESNGFDELSFSVEYVCFVILNWHVEMKEFVSTDSCV
jgi:hypothetical protein